MVCHLQPREGAAFPFAKVSKQMRDGLEDGIGGFFRAIPVIFEGHVRMIPPEG